MAMGIKLILLQLERCRQCFVVATRCADADLGAKTSGFGEFVALEAAVPDASHMSNLPKLQAITLAAGLEAIRAQLRRARRAADIVGSARLESPADLDSMASAAAEAAEALNFVAAAVTTPGGQLLGAEAAEAHTVLAQLARTVAWHQQQQIFAASDAARHASKAGNPAAAASAALQAQEAAGLAMWAARMGDLKVVYGTDNFSQDPALQGEFAAVAAQLVDASQAAAAQLLYGNAIRCPVAASDVDRPSHLGQLQKRPRIEILF